MTLYRRNVLTDIARFLHTDEVIVIHGARQVGKTNLLMFLQEQLRSAGEQTFYIDLEDSRFVSLLDKGIDELFVHLIEDGFNLPALRTSGLQQLFQQINVLPDACRVGFSLRFVR